MAAKKTTKKKTTKKAAPSGKALVIVESPAKARTIAKFLGKDYVIEASVGHIRDLPANASEVPAKYKKEKWSRLGINVEEDFKPLYVVPKDKREHMRKLKKLVKEASKVYLATDEDREGESISWHLVEELAPKVEIERLVFHEITKEAIQNAMQNTREIDYHLVEAQETRRLMDRLYGYSVSPLLWKKIRPKLSAGRVQSVAVRLIVEREQERMRWTKAEYWGLKGQFQGAGQAFEANLTTVANQRVAVGKDFDLESGQLKENKNLPLHLTKDGVDSLTKKIGGKDVIVHSLEQKPFTQRPSPPFTTSTLQQEASGKISFAAKRTMRAAQRLYENGYITYMRTDSTTLSKEAIGAARTLIEENYGKDNLPDEPRTYKSKVKNAQEAHEAIRPAGSAFTNPKDLGPDMGDDERKLYDLIWKRTVACQMKDATGKRTTLVLAVEDTRFQTTGRTIDFPGFRRAYVEGAEDAEAALAEADRILPNVKEGDKVGVDAYLPEEHATKPPARLSEASLIKEMEARGIGRPSTYASIIDTILNREYCFKKGTALVPTFTAFAVVNLMTSFLGYLLDYEFTAKMEDDLDEISNGKKDRLAYLKAFFKGNGTPGLEPTLESVEAKIDPRTVCTVAGYDFGPGPTGEPIEVRVGRYGPFLASDGLSASLPDGIAPDELTTELVQDLLAKAKAGPKSLGADPESGLQIFVKNGRFGPYFQRGDAESLGDEKPKMASLLEGMEEETVTLEDALACLALPRRLGKATTPVTPATDDTPEIPGEEKEILAYNGRFGPYLKWFKDTRSIPAEDHLLKIDLKRALELFSEPKKRGRAAARQAKVLKEVGKHPDSGADIKILEGRYGAYATDGTTNATVPKGEGIADMGLDRAMELISERAAKGPAKKKTKKKAAKKKATTKKAAKKAAKKKAAKKTPSE